MPILIDGHNLIGRLASVSLADQDDEEKLIRMLLSYRARTGKRITVVFDPGAVYALAETRRRGGLEVVFAPQGSDADRVIERRVRRSRNPQEWLVVTSDRALAEKVAWLGARTRSSDLFAAELSGPSDDPDGEWKSDAPSSKEVDEWLAVFGEREGDASSPEETNEFLAIFGEGESDAPLPEETNEFLAADGEGESDALLPEEVNDLGAVSGEGESDAPLREEMNEFLAIYGEGKSDASSPGEFDDWLALSADGE